MDLGVLAAALAFIALVLTQSRQAVEYVSYRSPLGGPASTAVLPITLNMSSGPVILIGTGALFVCLGSQVDARIRTSSRVAPLVLLLSGVVFCAITAMLASEIWLSLGNTPSDSARLTSPSAQLSLTVVFIPVTVVSGLCALVALARHQSRRSDDIVYETVVNGNAEPTEVDSETIVPGT